MMERKIPKRILNSLINSLSAGVVPRSGAPYIAIGRNEEVGLGPLLDGEEEVVPENLTWRGEPFLEHKGTRGGAKSGP